MQLLVKLTRYQDHVAGQLAEIEIDESNAIRLLEIAKAKYLAANWTGSSGDRVAVQKAEALMDTSVQELDSEVLTYKARRKLYTILVESLARDAAVVSREITRRTGGQKLEGRVNRFTP